MMHNNGLSVAFFHVNGLGHWDNGMYYGQYGDNNGYLVSFPG